MRAVDIIIKKRNGLQLSHEEIEFFIEGYTRGEIPDYQAAAWLMAVALQGMTAAETTDLTLAMARSGDMLDLSQVTPFAVDKHSTGGVGDKTTLVIAPLVAACGVPVGKMSGRGLGFSGGTLDKLESIPGYRCDLSTEEFLSQLREIGVVLTGQSANLAPADGKLYALRDVTGTVQSIPLIASSVMSKKIAAGAKGIVLDVKVGLGAFMQSLEEARRLAELMVSIAEMAGRKAVALLSDMNQPLGKAVGNALELKEAIAVLRQDGPADFRDHCLMVAAHMLDLAGTASDLERGRCLALQALESGEAWERFLSLVRRQGGDTTYVERPEKLPAGDHLITVTAPRTGYLSRIHARKVGETAILLGAGRSKKGDPIDYGVGIEVLHKVGDFVEAGEPLFVIHARKEADIHPARLALLDSLAWSDGLVPPLPLCYGVVEKSN